MGRRWGEGTKGTERDKINTLYKKYLSLRVNKMFIKIRAIRLPLPHLTAGEH